jgi:hypothetical protein
MTPVSSTGIFQALLFALLNERVLSRNIPTLEPREIRPSQHPFSGEETR